MSYLYVLESKMCVDKEVSDGSILWTRNNNGNENDEGDDESNGDEGDDYPEDDDNNDDVDDGLVESETRVAMVFLILGVFQLSKSGAKERQNNLKLKE